MVYHLFSAGDVQVYIYAANSDESAWEMLKRKIKQINDDSDIRLPDASKFTLTQKSNIIF
jgi:hypothetical protein